MEGLLGGTGRAKCEGPQRGCPRRGRLPARGQAAMSVQVAGRVAVAVHKVHRVLGRKKVPPFAQRCGGKVAQDVPHGRQCWRALLGSEAKVKWRSASPPYASYRRCRKLVGLVR